jgi:hypothetical protein
MGNSQPEPAEPVRDPVFERLQADLLEGVRAGEAGDVLPAEEVWQRLGLSASPPVPKAS